MPADEKRRGELRDRLDEVLDAMGDVGAAIRRRAAEDLEAELAAAAEAADERGE